MYHQWTQLPLMVNDDDDDDDEGVVHSVQPPGGAQTVPVLVGAA